MNTRYSVTPGSIGMQKLPRNENPRLRLLLRLPPHFQGSRDERIARQSIVNSINDVQIVFTDCRDVTTNSAEGFGTGASTEGALHFLLDLYHSDIAFDQIVVKGHAEVMHKRQDLRFELLETVEQVLGW